VAAYCRVYDSRHLQADCKEPGSDREPYARRSSMGYVLAILNAANSRRYGVLCGFGWIGSKLRGQRDGDGVSAPE